MIFFPPWIFHQKKRIFKTSLITAFGFPVKCSKLNSTADLSLRLILKRHFETKQKPFILTSNVVLVGGVNFWILSPPPCHTHTLLKTFYLSDWRKRGKGFLKVWESEGKPLFTLGYWFPPGKCWKTVIKRGGKPTILRIKNCGGGVCSKNKNWFD